MMMLWESIGRVKVIKHTVKTDGSDQFNLRNLGCHPQLSLTMSEDS